MPLLISPFCSETVAVETVHYAPLSGPCQGLRGAWVPARARLVR